MGQTVRDIGSFVDASVKMRFESDQWAPRLGVSAVDQKQLWVSD